MSGADGSSSTRADLRTLAAQPAFYAVMFMGMTLPLSLIISPALPGMGTDLGVSDARIGLVVTAITLPPMFLAPIAGVAGDMFGRRAVAIPGLFLYGAAGLAIVVAASFPVVLGLRVLQGVAIAGIAPLSVTLLGDLFDGSVATTAQGMRSSTSGISLAAGPVVAGVLAGLAWQYPFGLYALALPAMVAVYRWVPETAPDRESGTSVRGTLRQYARSIVAEISDPSLVVVLVGGFVRFFSLFAFFTFIPIFAVRVLGASASIAGLLVSLSGIRIVLAPSAGWWVSRFSRRWTLFGMIALQVTAIALVPFAPSVLVLAGLAVLYGFGDALFDPIINDGASTMVAAANRSGVVGGLRVLKEAGKTAAPAALGVVLGLAGYTALFYALTGVLAVYGVLVVLFLDRG